MNIFDFILRLLRLAVCWIPFLKSLDFCADDDGPPDLSPTAQTFVDMSVKPGMVTRTISEPVTVTDEESDQLVQVSGRATTREGGLVFLADVIDQIASVECRDDDTVVVQFVDDLLSSDIERMFPEDSLLVVREQDFGACFAGQAASPLEFDADGFLEVESVSLVDSKTVSVAGTQASVFSMFEDASVTIANVEEAVTEGTEGSLQGNAKVATKQATPFTKTFTKDLISDPSLSATVSGSLTSRSDITVVNSDFGIWGFDFTFRLVEDVDITADFVSTFQASASPSPYSKEILEPTRLGPPLKSLAKLLRKVGLIDENLENIADIRLGLFLEMNFKLEVKELSLVQQLGPFVDFDYKSGRTVTEINLFLKWNEIPIARGFNTNVIEDVSSSTTFDMGFNGLGEGENTEIKVDIEALFIPQVSLYLTKYAFAGLTLPFGFQLTGDSPELRVPKSSAAPPPVLLGECEECHRFESDLDSKIDPPRFVGKIDVEFSIFDVDIEEDRPLVSADSLSATVITYCGFADEDLTCNEMCCDAKPDGSCHPDGTTCCYAEDECCIDSDCDVDETCNEGICEGCTLVENECCADTDCSGLKTCQANVCVCPIGFKECDGICVPVEDCCPGDTCCDDPCCTTSACDEGGANGDPHMRTFDGLRYSCQAAGDFVLFQSDSGLSVHVRFKKKSALVSLASAVAIRGAMGETVVELVLRESAVPVLLVSGVETSTESPYEDEFVKIFVTGREFKVFLKGSSISIHAGVRLPSIFPHFNIRTTMPPAYSESNFMAGLLGSPDGNPSNDWTTVDGSVLPIPVTRGELYGEQGYNYCVTQWCIQTESESLFTYSDEAPFDSSACDVAYPGAIDITSASEELRVLCGSDETCLIDGIELGQEGALSLLEDESRVVSSSRLQVFPSTILVGELVNLVLTFDLRGSSVAGVDSFEIRRVDSVTRVVGSTVITNLLDVGLGVGNDTVANDMVFSNVIAFQADMAGDSFGFQAVPVFGGSPDPTSPLTTTSLSAVRSYSEASGIGSETTDTAVTLNLDSIDNVALVAQYTWPADVTDLDTGTTFLGFRVGYSCGGASTTYLEWSGDDTSTGGIEIVKARLGESRAAGLWTSVSTVDFRAGWYACSVSRGPMTLTVFTERSDGEGGTVSDGNAVSFVARPGCQNGCADYDVGSATITVAPDGSATILLTPPAL